MPGTPRPMQAQTGPAEQERQPGEERTPEDQRPPEERERQGKSVEDRIQELEAALAASRGAAPLNPIPEHGAGEGIEVAETWSLYDQQRMIFARQKRIEE